MEERKLTETESLKLITDMIQKTKSRLEIGDGNVMLIWGYICVIVGILVYVTAITTGGSPYSMLLWFLIPLVGGASMAYLKRRFRPTASAQSTYVDKISAGIWKLVGTVMGVCGVVCVAFMLMGYNAWSVMFVLSIGLVGLAAAIQGVVIREKSLIAGGIVSVAASVIFTSCVICHIPLRITWSIPLFVLCFVLMMIVPGHVINRKAKKLCSKN